jgi:antitoxin component of MazEF toxin-antitoxin module
VHQPASATRATHKPTPVDLPDELRASVTMLASRIGERNCYRPEGLEAAAAWIESEFTSAGLAPRRLPVPVPGGPPFDCGAQTVWNIEAEKRGTTRPDEVIVIGAHYDSKVATAAWHDHGPPLPDRPGTPGANDNASGVATVLALARMLADVPTERTIRFVAFVNEEPPFFRTEAMGSRVYARSCAGDPSAHVVGMFTPETLGCYSERPHRKRWRIAGLAGLPDRSDYVAFLGNGASRRFLAECADVFRKHSPVAVRTAALPAVSSRVAWSDDWSFWQEGIPAFTVTDTAYLRSDDYHELADTADRLDYGPMAEVVWGLRCVVEALTDPNHPQPGKSQGLRLSKELLSHAEIGVGDRVEVGVRDGAIVIEPVRRVRGRYDLKDLVSRIPKGHQPEETDWGRPAGKEVW